MGKLYRIDTNLDTSKFTPNGGFLMYSVEKTSDPRGFKERTGTEIFAHLCNAAITGANQRCSYDELKGFRKVQGMIEQTSKTDGILVCNKTETEVIKNSIRGNKNWINSDEMMAVLDDIMGRIDQAETVE